MLKETQLENRLHSKLKELQEELTRVENLKSQIANDWGLKNHIGTLERDKILSYYTKQIFRIEEKIKLLTAISEGE